MFLSVVDPRTGAMRFHDLFRELMEIELGSRDPEQRLRLHRRAGSWRARGDLMSAYRHLSVDRRDGEGPRAARRARRSSSSTGATSTRSARSPASCRRRPMSTNAHLAARPGRPWRLLRRHARRPAGGATGRPRSSRPTAPAGADDAATLPPAVHLHGIECAINLLEADLDAAIAGIETHRKLAVGPGIPAADVVERRFPILARRGSMLGARRMDEAAEWIDVAERIDGPGIVTEVAVPTLRAWYEWLFGSLHRCCELVDGALAWMAEHRVGAHHLAFDTLITGGWSRLSTGHLAEATALAERAWADAETLGYAWNQLQAGFLGPASPSSPATPPAPCASSTRSARPSTSTDAGRTPTASSARGRGARRQRAAAIEAATRMIETLEPGPRAAAC